MFLENIIMLFWIGFGNIKTTNYFDDETFGVAASMLMQKEVTSIVTTSFGNNNYLARIIRTTSKMMEMSSMLRSCLLHNRSCYGSTRIAIIKHTSFF